MSGPGWRWSDIREALATVAPAAVEATPMLRAAKGILDWNRRGQEAFDEKVRSGIPEARGWDPREGASIRSVGPVEGLLGRVRAAVEPRAGSPYKLLKGAVDLAAGTLADPSQAAPGGGAAHALSALGKAEDAVRFTGKLRPAVKLPDGRVFAFQTGAHNTAEFDLVDEALGKIAENHGVMGFVDDAGRFGSRDLAAAHAGVRKGESSLVREAQNRDVNRVPGGLPLVPGTEQYARRGFRR